jgi:hypothetical protein
MTGGRIDGGRSVALTVVRRVGRWRNALYVAVAVALVSLAIAVLVTGPEYEAVTRAVWFFFVWGALSPLIAGSGDAGASDEDRAWALRHPWLFAVPPAVAAGAALFVVRRALTLWTLDETVVASAVQALASAGAALLILGLAGMVVRRRSEGG